MTNPDSYYYTAEFKQKVVQEVLSGQRSVQEAMRHYEIGGKMTIYKWLDRHRALKIGILDSNESVIQGVDMNKESKRNKELIAELAALKRLLDVERKRSESYLTMIKLAEQRFNIPIEKKSGAKLPRK